MKKILATFAFGAFVTAALMANSAFNNAGVMLKANADTKDLKNEIHELKNSLTQTKKESEKFKNEMAQATANAASVESEIKALDIEISNLTAQTKTLETLVNQITQLSQQQELEIQELEKKEQEAQKIFDSMLRMDYEYGNDTYFNLIFGSESIGDFLSRVDLIKYHQNYNVEVMKALSVTRAELEKKREEQRKSLNDIDTFDQELKSLADELEEKSTAAIALKQQYDADAEKAKEMYEKFEDELDDIESLIAETQKKYEAELEKERLEALKNSTTYTPTTFNGEFIFPLAKGYSYRISSYFASRNSPISGKAEFHNGLDLAAGRGTPILAADGGTVIRANYSSSWGNVVIIDHGNGMSTLYAHANSLAVSKNQSVKAGDVIAYVGSTGWSTGNHLHFTVYKNGVAVDPYPYIFG